MLIDASFGPDALKVTKCGRQSPINTPLSKWKQRGFQLAFAMLSVAMNGMPKRGLPGEGEATIGKKTFELRLRMPIQPVRAFLEAFAIGNCHCSASGVKDGLALQLLKGSGHAGPPHAQHQGQKLVRQFKRIRTDAVPRHQQPARQTLFDLAPSVRKRTGPWVFST